MNDTIRVKLRHNDGTEEYVEDDGEPLEFCSVWEAKMCANTLQPLYPDVHYYVVVE